MKRTTLVSLILVVWASPVFGGPTVKLFDGFGGGSGGEFEVDIISGPIPYLWNVNNGLKNSGREFGTFCIEKDEFISFNILYDVTISDMAHGGGNNTNTGDLIDPRTAYLFTHYSMGTLQSYDYANSSLREGDGTNLQKVFWFLENEYKISGNYSYDVGDPTKADDVLTGQALTWWTEADQAVDSGAWIGIGNVRALNLTEGGAEKQSQLILIPVPGAALLASLGIGLLYGRRIRVGRP